MKADDSISAHRAFQMQEGFNSAISEAFHHVPTSPLLAAVCLLNTVDVAEAADPK